MQTENPKVINLAFMKDKCMLEVSNLSKPEAVQNSGYSYQKSTFSPLLFCRDLNGIHS